MYNDILKIGPVTVKGYGLMIAIGFIVAIYVGEWLARKKEIDDQQDLYYCKRQKNNPE